MRIEQPDVTPNPAPAIPAKKYVTKPEPSTDTTTLIVVDNPKDFVLDVPNVQVVSARTYLSDSALAARRRLKVFNLCKSYRYQSVGYYVSLLAEARGHRPLPSVSTIQDMKMQTLIRFTSDELDDLIQKTLELVPTSKVEVHIYFGRNVYSLYEKLALQLFNLFQAPFLRADFVKRDGNWELQAIGPIATSDIPQREVPHVIGFSREYFAGKRRTSTKEKVPRYDLAILYDAKDKMSPSDEKAIKRIVRAAEAVDIGVELITKDDYARIGEFDALLIRETTAVNHHTYRFARRAAAEGLVVIDDPVSILRCTNKVYLAELLQRHNIPVPKTLVVHDDNVDQVEKILGLPCVLKQPDSAFSQGVMRADTQEQLESALEDFLERSELVIAQEYIPTEFDWRVGVLDKKPLFICKYFMARRHWQIVKNNSGSGPDFGRVQCVPAEEAPPELIRVAIGAANLIGDGLYGVDVKQLGDKFLVIEVNDNPNIDAGYEDSILKDTLYTRLIDVFVRRLEARTDRNARP
ncbi:MAG: RimK family protein [Clostridia bacterium]|nr:RimK family protein [Deltaproteobacteria bacterium]